MMTRTDRRGNPILDGVETAVAAARVAVSSALEAAFRCVSSTDAPIAVIQHSWAALFRLTRADLCRVAARAERTPRGYVNRCVNDIRRRPSQPLI